MADEDVTITSTTTSTTTTSTTTITSTSTSTTPTRSSEFEEAQAEALRRRALAQIRQYPDVALRMKAHDVTEFDEELVQLVERMQLLMKDAQGVGLAATQLGMLRRVFVFAPDDETARRRSSTRGSLDPSDEKETDEEGCLSLRERPRPGRAVGAGRRSRARIRPARTCGTSSKGSPRGSCSTSSTISTAC